MMQSKFILRISSQILSAITGGIFVFCLYYAGQVPDPNAAWSLCAEALKWAGIATTIVYCQNRYLGQ
jgi:hypothetical protein